MVRSDPAGYTYGQPQVPASPVALHELAQLMESVQWSPADDLALRRAGAILAPRTDEIVDVWYRFIEDSPHLVSTFVGKDGTPDPEYIRAVRRRFARWIDDLCNRPYDETWLAYQEEIARRHHLSGKNTTDGIESMSGHIPLRHVIALITPITLTLRPFLQSGSTGADDLQQMLDAWLKAVTLTVALWARPYNETLW
ncbi:protoglobin domain-containing protein [Microbacterium sp. CFBP9034]|uniref:protoglobin domain-containing protein n=1 Tax=Microbacterium sp. CFBP9034 TaxID=3096540 RepID=UPI002A6AC753|nr:protoglobin domain-containing protein [Microbacterium sp. CFBP9034]MDY0910137.1 protoglobin domain-containing protein [Microbacterium sp. CFBP9034]